MSNDAQSGQQLPVAHSARDVRTRDAGRSVAAEGDAVLRPAGLEPSYGGGAYGGAPEGEDVASFFRSFMAIIMARRWLILSMFVAIVGLTALVSSLQTPRYTATVRIQIERDAGKIVEGADANPTEVSGGQEFLKTQFELLRGRQLAERVVATLQLQNQADAGGGGSILGALRGLLSPPRTKRTDDEGAARQRAAAALSAALTVRPVPGSRLIDISYEDTSPQRAQRVANGYAEVFVSANLDKRFDANAYAKTFLEDQVKQLALRVEESERTVVEYAEREQMLDSSDKLTLADQNLGIANNALGAATTERLKQEQMYKQISEATGINFPQILSNVSIEQLRQRRNALVTEYEEKLETFKPNYPGMVQIKNKMAEVDRQLAVEVRAVRDSLKASFESAQKQEDEQKSRVEALRVEALNLQRKGIQYNALKRDAETNRNLYNSLLQRLKQIDVAAGVGTNNVLVVDRAALPESASSPRIVRAIALASFLSLLLGIGLAYLLEMLDDRIKSPEDIEAAVKLPVLGVIPKVSSTNAVTELEDARSHLSESYRSLATALQFSSKDGLPRSIVITSGGPAEGKSSTATALARHFALMGLRVLLVDADMRRPSLHTKLGLDNSVGLSNFLTGAMKPPQVIQATSFPNLAFMSAGPIPPNAADLLGGNRMFSLVTVGLEIFDLIIIDAPPLLGLADALLLSSAAHATMFIAAAGQVRKRFVRSAMQRIMLTRTNVVGVVLTKFDANAAGYGYGYGGYGGYGASYYGNAYGSENAPSSTGQVSLPAGAR